MSVVVVHPQVQHSFQLVRALHEAGLLKRFYTSIFFTQATFSRLPWPIRKRLQRRVSVAIPADKVWTFPYCEFLLQIARVLFKPRWESASLYYSLWTYDRVAARRLVMDSPRIVIGFENSSLELFRAAKRLGVICVLDAASVHFRFQGRKRRLPFGPLQRRVDARKAEEISLADRIVVLSSFAKQTYIDAGVPPEKLELIAPGADLSLHTLKPSGAPRPGFHFLFVGNLTWEKGIDLLISAFKALEIPGKTLTLVGAIQGDMLELIGRPPNVEWLGHLSSESLREEYRRADVLILPSRLDGFGLVVAESMATGTPVIVSSAAGAKDLVRRGENGWIFESESSTALAEAMEISYRERNRLAQMGTQARETVAGEYTWDAYRKRIGTLYENLLKSSFIR